jgi:hypothetical protein
VDDPSALLFSYCAAIEFLKNQFDEGGNLQSTVLQRRVHVPEFTDVVRPVLFKFGSPENAPDPFALIHGYDVMVDGPMRAMLTTPTDVDGRERELMVPEDRRA